MATKKNNHNYKHFLELFQDRNRKWRWRFCHRNGRILVSSEAYANITMARRASFNLIASIKEDDFIITITK